GQLTLTVPSGLATAVTLAGASGTSEVGMTGLEFFFGPSPSAFTACTANVYVWPLVRPVMSMARWVPTVIGWRPPSTTYLVITEPLSGAGLQTRWTVVLPAVARPPGARRACRATGAWASLS